MVTERADDSALHAQALLASIVSGSSDAIISKTLDGTILSWNAAAERLFGYSAPEVIGRSITLIIPPDRLDEETAILDRLRLRLVADHAAVMLVHCDADSRYLFVNHSYTSRFGLQPRQVIGRRIPDVIGGEAYAGILPYVRRALEGERVEFETELDYDALGRRFVHCVYVPERDPATERVRGFVAAISDVSDRRRLEEQLRESDRRKDEFLAILGHEIRNPLAALKTSTEMLNQARAKPDLVDVAQRMMQRQLRQLLRLADDLLDISRIRRGIVELRMAPIDLRTVAEAAVEQTKSLISSRRHELTTRYCDAELPVEGDVERLTQVIANLLTNAAKYTEDGGSVSLTTEKDGGHALVRVRDTGVGIPREQLEHIFEMFGRVPEQRLSARVSGLGVGLALCRHLVALHGGSIEGRSDGPGNGSEFVVRLPVRAAELIQAPEAALHP